MLGHGIGSSHAHSNVSLQASVRDIAEQATLHEPASYARKSLAYLTELSAFLARRSDRACMAAVEIWGHSWHRLLCRYRPATVSGAFVPAIIYACAAETAELGGPQIGGEIAGSIGLRVSVPLSIGQDGLCATDCIAFALLSHSHGLTRDQVACQRLHVSIALNVVLGCSRIRTTSLGGGLNDFKLRRRASINLVCGLLTCSRPC